MWEVLFKWGWWKAVIAGGLSMAFAAILTWFMGWTNYLINFARNSFPLVFGNSWETQLNKLGGAWDSVSSYLVLVENFFPVNYMVIAVSTAYLTKLTIRFVRHLLGLIPAINAG